MYLWLAIADKLGVAPGKVQPFTEEYVRQVQIIGWLHLLVAGITFLLFLVAIMVSKKAVIAELQKNWRESCGADVAGVCCFVGLILFAVWVGFLYTGLMRIFLPYTYLW